MIMVPTLGQANGNMLRPTAPTLSRFPSREHFPQTAENRQSFRTYVQPVGRYGNERTIHPARSGFQRWHITPRNGREFISGIVGTGVPADVPVRFG